MTKLDIFTKENHQRRNQSKIKGDYFRCKQCGLDTEGKPMLENGKMVFCSFKCHDVYMDKQEEKEK